MEGHVSPRPFPLVFSPATFAGAQAILLTLAKRLALPVLCLGGFALRLHLLSAWPLREDEAMYSVWALHLWRVDPWALTLWPDKPPLFLWLLGGTFQLFGPSEAAARLLNIAADTLTIGVVAATGRVLWNRRAGIFAGLAYALSPFALSFAPTAYTDPTLVLWGMLALYASLTRRSLWAGLFLAAAIATKQQGLLYAPLIVGVLLLATKTQRDEEEKGKRQKGKAKVSAHHSSHSLFTIRYSPLRQAQDSAFAIFLLGFVLLTLPVLLWDASRWAVAPSPWDLSVRNYAPLALLPPENWLPRLAQWASVAWNLAGSWWVVGYWILGIGYWVGTRRRPIFNIQYPIPIILIWSVGFVVSHITTSVQIWDRYLLPLAPVLALFVGWIGLRSTSHSRRRFQPMLGWFAAAILPLLLLPPALTAARGGLPVGADHGDYAGLNESVAWLRANAPVDAIIYHRDVSWQLRFAFFAATPDQPDASEFELRWFPNAVYLADNGAKSPERRKFLVEPTWAAVDSAAQRLQQRAIGWQERLRAGNFTLYELTSPPSALCDWCLCVEATTATFPDWFAKPASQHLSIPSGTLP